MQKQSLAEKSVYWLKVISLGLILGVGIQFAKAWTPPTLPPPGGTISGPLTNGIAPQYKTGMLGINSTITPVNALEVGGGGNAYIGGSINATSGTVTGVLTSGKVQIVDVVIENTTCLSNGLVAKDSTGILLSCQGPGDLKWKKASGGSGANGGFDVNTGLPYSCVVPIAVNHPAVGSIFEGGGTPSHVTVLNYTATVKKVGTRYYSSVSSATGTTGWEQMSNGVSSGYIPGSYSDYYEVRTVSPNKFSVQLINITYDNGNIWSYSGLVYCGIIEQ